MVAIKETSMPKYCNDCDFVIDSMGYCERANEQIPNYDFFSETNERPNFCPLVEIEERKHGKWEHDKLFGECAYVCSFCHTIWTSSEIENMHYCPTCGAEMINTERGKE